MREAERELSLVEETPQIVALHPATLDSYIATVDRLAAVLTDHIAAKDDRGSRDFQLPRARPQRDRAPQGAEGRLSGRGKGSRRSDRRQGVPPGEI